MHLKNTMKGIVMMMVIIKVNMRSELVSELIILTN